MDDLLLYLLLLLAWSIFNNYFLHKLKNLPPTPLTAWKIIISIWSKKPIHQTLSEIATSKGPILLLRLGFRRVLLISSSSAAEDLFTKNDAGFANRPKMLVGKVFGCKYANLAWAPYGDLWRFLRHVSCQEIIPFHCRLDQHKSLANDVKLLLGQLFQTENKIVELKPMFQDLVLNVMTSMFVGKRYWGKKLTSKEEVMVSNSLREYVIQSFKMTTGETDVGYFMPISKLFGVTRGLEQRCNELQEKGDSLIDGLIEEIRTKMRDFSDGSGEKEEKAIEFLLLKQKENPKRYPDEMIRGLVLVLMSAGTDTSAGTLEWAFSLLLNHPEILRKARNEIDNYVSNDRFMDQLDIDHLPYLNCIVKETTRLYPMAPLLVPHESSKECMVGGYRVPKGTMLMVNVRAIQNDPKIWDEPAMFYPERFENLLGERDGFKLMPFGYGKRSCPGKNMALRVITLALGSLIHCFDWDRVSEEMVDMTEQTGLALFKAKPLMAVCRPRPTMVNLLSQI